MKRSGSVPWPISRAGAGRLLLKRLQLEGEEELPADLFAERQGLRIGGGLGAP